MLATYKCLPSLASSALTSRHAANESHGKGKHPAEWKQVGGFVDHLLAEQGQVIEGGAAPRFIGCARDLIAGGG